MSMSPAYIVASLLALIALLVVFGFGLIWFALLSIQCFPSFTEDFANLACIMGVFISRGHYISGAGHTKADARVLLSHVVTLLVGKEHVSGEATLGRVGIWEIFGSAIASVCRGQAHAPFFFLPPASATLALVLRVAFSLGMVMDLMILRVSQRVS